MAGCEPSPDTGPLTEVRDSSGIGIVENAGEVGPDGGGWSVEPDPVLSIGTLQGDSIYQLFQVQGAARLADGRLVVSNSSSGEVRLYDVEGRFLTAHGRKGEGPGEFQRPALAGVLGRDTLVVVDQQLRRISFLHADEGFLFSTRLSDDVGGGAYPQGMLAGGTLILGGGFYWSSDGGVELSSGYSRRATRYWAVGLDGELVADFGEFPGSEFFMEVQTGAGGAVSMRAQLIPFGKHAMQAVGLDRFFFGSGDEWEIQGFDGRGGLDRLIRTDREPLPVRDQDMAAYVDERVEEAGDPSESQAIRAGFEEMPVPDAMPAFAGLHADKRGYLWVERYRLPGDEVPVFDILDPEGRLVGQVTLPPLDEILEIGDDHVLGLFRDELDVEYVRLFRLQRPKAGGGD